MQRSGPEPLVAGPGQKTSSPRRDWLRLAVAVWAVLLIGVSVRVLVWPRTHTTFPIFAAAALDWLNGEDLYLIENERRLGLDHYRYSPLVAALMVPFGLLPEGAGGVLWRLLNAGVFLSAAAWWLRVAAPLAVTRVQKAAFFLLLVPLAVTSLNNGQSNLLVIGLLVAGVAAAAERRWNLAAGCVVLACLFKVYPIVVGLLLTLLSPRRLGPRLAVGLLLGMAFPFALQRPEYVANQYATWFHLLLADDRRSWPVTLGYQDLWMLVRIWRVPLSPLGYFVLQVGSGVGIALICLSGRWAAWPERRLLAMVLSFGSCWMTLLGPATESSTYALLGPALAWAVVEAWGNLRPRAFRALPALSLAFFLLAGCAGWFPWRAEIRGLGVLPLGGLALLAGLAAALVWDVVRPSAAAGRAESWTPARAA